MAEGREGREEREGSRWERERSPLGGGSATSALQVHNLPFNWTWKELKAFVRDKVGDRPKFAELLEGDKKGQGYVEFTSTEQCSRAFNLLKGVQVEGRKTFVNYIAPQYFSGPAVKKQRVMNNRRNEFERVDDFEPAGESIAHNTYGLNQQFLESLGISGPLVPRIFILNLDFKVDEAKLREVFKMAGRIVDLELHLNKEGRTKGLATIEYEHPVEAVQAISMFNNQTLYERTMSVRMERYDSLRDRKAPDGLKGMGPGLGVDGTVMRNVARTIEKQEALKNSNDNQHSNNIQDNMSASTSMNANQPMWNNMAQMMLMNQATLPVPSMNPMGIMNMAMNPLLANTAQGVTPAVANNMMGNVPVTMNAGQPQNNTLLALASLQQQGVNMSDLATMLAQFTGQNSNQKPQSSATVSNQSKPDIKIEGRKDTSGPQNSRNSDMLIVTNLPATISRNHIHDKFREIGEIKFVDMTGPGSALVRYINHWDAETAIKAYDRTLVHNHIIDVQYYY